MASIFTQIINRTIEGYIIAETSEFIAFLDIHPLAVGHTLVVPKKEIPYLFDLEDKILAALIIFTKKIARGIQQVCPCLRVGMAVVGLEVPHAHIHLIPLNDPYAIDFKKPKLQQSPEELCHIAKQLQQAVRAYSPLTME